MANIDFDILLDDVQKCGRYATNIITMYQNFVSSHKVSVDLGHTQVGEEVHLYVVPATNLRLL
jgi:hypothetical protein